MAHSHRASSASTGASLVPYAAREKIRELGAVIAHRTEMSNRAREHTAVPSAANRPPRAASRMPGNWPRVPRSDASHSRRRRCPAVWQRHARGAQDVHSISRRVPSRRPENHPAASSADITRNARSRTTSARSPHGAPLASSAHSSAERRNVGVALDHGRTRAEAPHALPRTASHTGSGTGWSCVSMQVVAVVLVAGEMELLHALAPASRRGSGAIELVVARADIDVVDVEQDQAVGAAARPRAGTPIRSCVEAAKRDVARDVLQQDPAAEQVLHRAHARDDVRERLLGVGQRQEVVQVRGRRRRSSTGDRRSTPARRARPAP